jgi:signal transduction histidine kinase
MLSIFLARPIIPLLFLTALLNMTLGILVLCKNPRAALNRTFFCASMVIGLWVLAHAGSLLQTTDAGALLFEKLIMAAAAFIPVGFLWFSYQVTNPDFSPSKPFLIFHVVMVGGMFASAFSPWMVVTSAVRDTYVYWEIGPLYYIYSAYLASCSTVGLVVIFRAYQCSEGRKKVQLFYVLAGYLSSISIGLLINIIFPIMGKVELNRFGPLGTVFIVSFVFYSMVRHQLMDIRIFLRRAALLVVIYAGLAATALPIVFYLIRQLSRHSSDVYGSVFAAIFMLMVLMSAGPLIYIYFIRKNVFFQEQTLLSLTHELKSPLSAIEGALDLLIYEAQKKADDPKQKEYLEMIDRNSARLRGFVDELLLVMKSGAKTSQLNFEPVDMAELCREVMSTFEEAAKTKGNQLIFQGKESSHLNIDPAKIKKVLSNLLSNANKFTKNGAITVSLVEEKDRVRVQVADTGLGLAAGDIPYVFDTFYQTSAGQKAKGTGIGLSIAKLWVDAHGGSIGVESEGEGKGSCFWFTLPR